MATIRAQDYLSVTTTQSFACPLVATIMSPGSISARRKTAGYCGKWEEDSTWPTEAV